MAAKLIITMDGRSREIPLTSERLTIGRAAHNDLVIDHPAVSAEHAVIVIDGNDAYLQDLGSTNGTTVNGQPVMRHFLQDGDVIELAECAIWYVGDAAGPFPGLPQAPSSEFHAVLRILSGARAGEQIMLSKALTTIGRMGQAVAAIVNDANHFIIMHVDGKAYPRLNGVCIGETIRSLTYDDVIDLSGTQVVFCRESRQSEA